MPAGSPARCRPGSTASLPRITDTFPATAARVAAPTPHQAEQSILVDFSTFPSKLVDLFHEVNAAASASSGTPRRVWELVAFQPGALGD